MTLIFKMLKTYQKETLKRPWFFVFQNHSKRSTSEVVYIYIEGTRTNFLFRCTLAARYWGQKENKEKIYTRSYILSKKLKKELLFNYPPWLKNTLRKRKLSTVSWSINIPGKDLLLDLLCIEFLHVF